MSLPLWLIVLSVLLSPLLIWLIFRFCNRVIYRHFYPYREKIYFKDGQFPQLNYGSAQACLAQRLGIHGEGNARGWIKQTSTFNFVVIIDSKYKIPSESQLTS